MVADRMIRRECAYCGRPFWAYRTDAKYCTARCRMRAMRWRNKLPAAESRVIRDLAEIASYIGYPDSQDAGIVTLKRVERFISLQFEKFKVEKIK